VLDIVAGRPLHIIKSHQKTVTALSLASHSDRLISGALDGHLKVFETTGWNVVSGSKYPSPILSLRVITSGVAQEDKHLAVGMQSGLLSIKTRLSGQQKVRERERQKEMQALLEGKLEEHDRKKAKKEKLRGKGWGSVYEVATLSERVSILSLKDRTEESARRNSLGSMTSARRDIPLL
jgi:WD domain, G-beta repeat.